MQIKPNITRKVLHIASSGKSGFLALGGGGGCTPYNGLYEESGMRYLFLASGISRGIYKLKDMKGKKNLSFTH